MTTESTRGSSSRHRDALTHLGTCDPILGRIIEEVGPCRLRPGARGDHFTTLARAIVGQQLSGRAAETIWNRLAAQHPDPRRIRPQNILAMADADLRSAGLSAAKTASVRDLATRVASGELRLDRIGRRDDEAVIAELIEVRGIGRWTAEMFLMFKLGRPDVWPIGDLGIRNAVRRAYDREPTAPVLAELAEPWRPYRSVAAWYLWRSLDVEIL